MNKDNIDDHTETSPDDDCVNARDRPPHKPPHSISSMPHGGSSEQIALDD